MSRDPSVPEGLWIQVSRDLSVAEGLGIQVCQGSKSARDPSVPLPCKTFSIKKSNTKILIEVLSFPAMIRQFNDKIK